MDSHPNNTELNLLTLPAEIRLMIYETYFDGAKDHDHCRCIDKHCYLHRKCHLHYQYACPKVREVTNLFRTSTQIYWECVPLFWMIVGKTWSERNQHLAGYMGRPHTEAHMLSLTISLKRYAPALAAKLIFSYKVSINDPIWTNHWDGGRKREAKRLVKAIHTNELLKPGQTVKLPHRFKTSVYGQGLDQGITLSSNYNYLELTGPLAKLDWKAIDPRGREGRLKGIWSKLVGFRVRN